MRTHPRRQPVSTSCQPRSNPKQQSRRSAGEWKMFRGQRYRCAYLTSEAIERLGCLVSWSLPCSIALARSLKRAWSLAPCNTLARSDSIAPTIHTHARTPARTRDRFGPTMRKNAQGTKLTKKTGAPEPGPVGAISNTPTLLNRNIAITNTTICRTTPRLWFRCEYDHATYREKPRVAAITANGINARSGLFSKTSMWPALSDGHQQRPVDLRRTRRHPVDSVISHEW